MPVALASGIVANSFGSFALSVAAIEVLGTEDFTTDEEEEAIFGCAPAVDG